MYSGAQDSSVGASLWRMSLAKPAVICAPVDGLSEKSYSSWNANPKGVGSVFTAFNVPFTIGRNIVLTLHPTMDRWFQEVLEQDKIAQERNEPQPDLPQFPDLSEEWPVVHNSIIRDSWHQILRRLLEVEVNDNLPKRSAAKMLKDVRESIIRKADRGLTALQLTKRTARTAFLGNCLGYVSEMIVSQIVLCFRWFRANQLLARPQQDRGGLLKAEQLRREASKAWLARQTIMMLTSVSLRLMGSSLLIGLLANAMPKYASQTGLMLGDLAISTIVAGKLGNWANQ